MANIKTPTHEDYNSYSGAHCHKLWAEHSDTWECPSCSRTKFQLMRWATRYSQTAEGGWVPYKEWMAGLHMHHDHSQGLLSSSQARFEAVVVCDQCHAADGVVKKKLSLPKNFSFSPSEIKLFVTAAAHTKHTINFEIAQILYARISSGAG